LNCSTAGIGRCCNEASSLLLWRTRRIFNLCAHFDSGCPTTPPEVRSWTTVLCCLYTASNCQAVDGMYRRGAAVAQNRVYSDCGRFERCISCRIRVGALNAIWEEMSSTSLEHRGRYRRIVQTSSNSKSSIEDVELECRRRNRTAAPERFAQHEANEQIEQIEQTEISICNFRP